MVMLKKAREIINKFYEFATTGNKKLIEKYTLVEIKQAKYHYKHNNLKELDSTPFMDDVINGLEYIAVVKNREREKWTERLIGFVIAIIVILVSTYLIKLF
jgi:hypothetical protein